MNPISSVVVAIPARNEEDFLGPCLASVRQARAAACATRPDLAVAIVVALDGCTDRSREVAQAHRVETVEIAACARTVSGAGTSGVGTARDAAIRAGLRHLGHPSPVQTWLACTDADTVVPSTWLARQFIWADRGMDLVVGTVHPDDLTDPVTRRLWRARHDLAEGHRHIHGANLGVRANRWHEVGGFGGYHRDEDVALVTGVQRLTPHWVATDSTRVLTSGRLSSRVSGGFADYLKTMTAQAQ